MGKIIPKTDPESQAFWESVAEVAREVDTWPDWKKGKPMKSSERLFLWARLAEQTNTLAFLDVASFVTRCRLIAVELEGISVGSNQS